MREAPARDRAVGLEYFVSETDGIGGQLKVEPEDFRVVEVGEIDPEPLEADPSDYPYVLLGVTLRQWETHAFVDRLGGELGVGRRAIDWAGTKDKHAVTEQLFSVAWDPDAFPAVDIDGARIEPIGRFGRRLHFGDLLGNTFQIRVRCPVHPERVDAITDELVAFGAGSPAVPNYFGHQRFGSLRPVTHEVGRALLSEGWEAAVMTYLCLSTDEEPPETQAARSFIRETRDWERGLERMPRRLGYERTLLSSLAEAGDPEEADFREAEGEDGVVVPIGGGVVEYDAGEGHSIGIVDDKRDAVLAGDSGEAPYLAVGEDVAGRVGGAGDADGGDVGGDFEVVEIDAVFEFVIAGFHDAGRDGVEEVAIDALVGVADVFWDERQEDAPAGAIGGHAPGEQVEEEEKSGLTAGGDGDVFLADLPAERIAAHGGHGVEEAWVAARRVVAGDGAVQAAVFFEDFLHAATPYLVHLLNPGGLAATEHLEIGSAGGERVAKIDHEVADAAVAAEMAAEFGKLI